jgi:hypothetical protein
MEEEITSNIKHSLKNILQTLVWRTNFFSDFFSLSFFN